MTSISSAMKGRLTSGNLRAPTRSDQVGLGEDCSHSPSIVIKRLFEVWWSFIACKMGHKVSCRLQLQDYNNAWHQNNCTQFCIVESYLLYHSSIYSILDTIKLCLRLEGSLRSAYILGKLKHMCTIAITHAIGTRPYFNWPGIEASTSQHAVNLYGFMHYWK